MSLVNKLKGILEPQATLVGQLEVSNEINVEIVSSGPRGPEGKSNYDLWLEDGNKGTLKDFLDSLATTSDAHYEHKQITPSDEWRIEHPLQKFSSVTIVDSGNSIVIGDVEYISDSMIIIRFNGAFSGKAYLN